MDEKLKTRLIGVLVVVGAVFIILPFLFHNSHPSAVEKIAPSASVSSPIISVALPAENTASPATPKTMSDNPSAPTVPAAAQTQTVSPSQSPSNSSPKTQPPFTASSKITQVNAVTESKKLNANTVAASTLAAGFKPDQAVSPTSGLTTGAPISAPPAMNKIASASAFDYASLNQPQTAPAAASSTHHTREHHHQLVTHSPHHVKAKAVYSHAAKHPHYVTQLAVFSDPHNAKKLIAKLHAHHIPAYTHHIAHNGKRMTAVWVGPNKTHGSAVIMQSRLHHVFHLNGIVRIV